MPLQPANQVRLKITFHDISWSISWEMLRDYNNPVLFKLVFQQWLEASTFPDKWGTKSTLRYICKEEILTAHSEATRFTSPHTGTSQKMMVGQSHYFVFRSFVVLSKCIISSPLLLPNSLNKADWDSGALKWMLRVYSARCVVPFLLLLTHLDKLRMATAYIPKVRQLV